MSAGSLCFCPVFFQVFGEHRQHDPSLACRLGEEHFLFPLRRHVHVGREVVFPGFDCRNAPCEIHVAKLQRVAPVPAEADDQVDIIANVLPILDIGKWHVRRGGDDFDRTVFPVQA